MKFWNKKKGRDRWTKVPAPTTKVGMQGLKQWCHRHPSKGKFYAYFAANYFYFELPEDALMFTLTWSNT